MVSAGDGKKGMCCTQRCMFVCFHKKMEGCVVVMNPLSKWPLSDELVTHIRNKFTIARMAMGSLF